MAARAGATVNGIGRGCMPPRSLRAAVELKTKLVTGSAQGCTGSRHCAGAPDPVDPVTRWPNLAINMYIFGSLGRRVRALQPQSSG
jgi:hypothetical protein